MEEAKSEKKNRKKNGDVAVEGSAEGTQNVAAVELRNGQEIERSGEETNPGGASDGIKQEFSWGNAGM